MSSPALIDIETLLKPISDDTQFGNDLRSDNKPTSLYSQIRDARKNARATERSSMFDGGSSDADKSWQKVLELAPVILKSHSKDLEIATWYTEALVRKAGFQGLRDSFRLIRQLLELYWDGIYPLPDDDGLETRVAPLTGLNGEGAEGVIIAPIRNIALTENIPPGPFRFWQYKQALDTQRISDDRNRLEQESKLGFTLANIQTTVEQSSDTFYLNLRDDVRDSLDEYRKVSQLLDEYCGRDHAPPTSNITSILDDILGMINHVAKLKLPQAAIEGEASTTDAQGNVIPGKATFSGPIKTRDDAFRQLRDISDFFRRTEPHSPISYVVEKAVKWGNMSLVELIRELIPDNNSRQTYSSLTGVQSSED